MIAIRNVLLAAALTIAAVSAIWAQAGATVRAIEPPANPLPSESASAGETRFAFIAYGDTRGQADGDELQIEHGKIVDRVLAAVKTEAAAGFPVRFVIQSGDGVTNGSFPEQWNVSFSPLIDRLTKDGGLPYFFAAGNHDLGGTPAGSAAREPRLRNTANAMAKLWPPEGSPRRLIGYPTFSFGYGRYFFIVLDSNIAADDTQLKWVTAQLEGLDRTRFQHVIVSFHHPPITSGPHGGPTLVEPQTETIRRVYLPLFRKHHVRMTITGHDHLIDHWVEHYADASGAHRMDHLVSGGGGAPTYTYRGEPDLAQYAAAAAPLRIVSMEHLAKPGPTEADNPHHFTIIEVDGDRMWIQAIGTGPKPFLPYGAPRIELIDR